MKFVYLIIIGFISLLVTTEVLLNIVKLTEFKAVLVSFAVSFQTMIFLFIKNSFKKIKLKDFLISLFIGFLASAIALSILKELSIDQNSSSLLIGLLIGMYSYEKIANKKQKIESQNSLFAKRECPCCEKEISLKYFFRQFLVTKSKDGFKCKKCNKRILSADKKVFTIMPFMMVSMMPIFLLGLKGISFALNNILLSISILLGSFILYVLFVYRKYYYIDFICDDENSNKLIKYIIGDRETIKKNKLK